MKALDRFLQRRRFAQARPFVRKGDTVLDVGCADGEIFEAWRGHIKYGYGVDPRVERKVETPLYTLLPGFYPEALPPGTTCDVITMLAVLEHLKYEDQSRLAQQFYQTLNPGGRLVITVPSPRVDHIIHFLSRIGVLDGMAQHEHYGFDVRRTPSLFPMPLFQMVEHQRFQLGLNNLFVFKRLS
jgi:SAM-dependent methyltransferase